MPDSSTRPALSAILAGEEVRKARHDTMAQFATMVRQAVPHMLVTHVSDDSKALDALCAAVHSAVCAHYEGRIAELETDHRKLWTWAMGTIESLNAELASLRAAQPTTEQGQ